METKKVIEIAEIDNGYWVTIQSVNTETRAVEKVRRFAFATRQQLKASLEIELNIG